MLTHERLLRLLSYDPVTGHFTWLINKYRIKIGDLAGSAPTPYIRIKIDQKSYLAQRLAWFYVTGKWPKSQVDHKNTIKSDNRWSNLREATRLQNARNIGKISTNKSGFKGVHYSEARKKWVAMISINCKTKNLGRYDTAQEAAFAYERAAIAIHGDFYYKS